MAGWWCGGPQTAPTRRRSNWALCSPSPARPMTSPARICRRSSSPLLVLRSAVLPPAVLFDQRELADVGGVTRLAARADDKRCIGRCGVAIDHDVLELVDAC